IGRSGRARPAAVGGSRRPAREQCGLRRRPRGGGRELDRTGTLDLRDELLRDRPDDARGRAAHATPRGWPHHQHRLRAGLLAAAKHAVEGYSESLDHEVRTWCIRVSVIEPAYTKTHFEANLLEPDATLDEYREARATVSRQVRAVLETADEPGVVADVVLEAARADRPKLRYTAGGLANRLRLLRRFAPAGAVDAGIRRTLRLDAPVASPPATKVLG